MYDVVLIDDEEIIVKGLSNAFPWKEYACKVTGSASDGQEGLRVIHRLQPQLLITDIRMPNLDGLNMIAALGSEFPNLKIIVLTAYRNFDYAQQAIRLGVHRYLLKPSRMEELHEAVKSATEDLKQHEVKHNQEKQEALPSTDNEASSLIVQKALAYLDDNFVSPLTLDDVAQKVYVSQWHLSKLINRHTGKSFFELINDRRIQSAKDLLQKPELRVSDVALMVGYQDTAHFCRIFKKLTGKSPMVYRNQTL